MGEASKVGDNRFSKCRPPGCKGRVAKGLNRNIKDAIRNCQGFNSFEALRRRRLIRLGSPREPGGPIPLFTRSEGKEGEED